MKRDHFRTFDFEYLLVFSFPAATVKLAAVNTHIEISTDIFAPRNEGI
jgi:hypothetical protein